MVNEPELTARPRIVIAPFVPICASTSSSGMYECSMARNGTWTVFDSPSRTTTSIARAKRITSLRLCFHGAIGGAERGRGGPLFRQLFCAGGIAEDPAFFGSGRGDEAVGPHHAVRLQL